MRNSSYASIFANPSITIGEEIMETKDFVYDTIYKSALKLGAKEREAHNAAVTGLEDYKKGRYKKASKLIADKISVAIKESKY